MDPIYPGRGLADTLPESLVAAGAEGVMLNHVEKPLDFETLAATIKRAEEVGLTTIVCADSEEEAAKIATLNPDIIVAEPSALIGTGVSVGPEYVEAATKCVKDVNPDILVLTAAGIAGGEDVYNTIIAGADAEEVILLRLRNAAEEDARMGEYQFALVSADRESDYARFTALLTALSMRTGL